MIRFPSMKNPEYVWNDGFFFQWCCNCNLRHIWHFHIERGKTPEEDYVVISIAGDRIATKLRKFYNKKIK